MSYNLNADKERREEATRRFETYLTTDLIVREAEIMGLLTGELSKWLSGARAEAIRDELDIIREIVNKRLYG